MYEIEYTLEAVEDLKRFRKYEQRLIVDDIDDQLSHEPSHETRNRKRLRPNVVSEYGGLDICAFSATLMKTKELLRSKLSAIKSAALY